jgi:predicted GIY-YIG superfamily endonuclease
MLACIKDGRFCNFYTGQTNNLRARVGEHIQNVMDGNTRRYTGRFDAVRLVWHEKCYTRQDALELEQEIKQMSWSEKMELIK